MSDNEDENVSFNEPPSRAMDPYAILKVDCNASDEVIQRSFKLLSRNFHPDMQPPGPSRDAAQEVFVSFKNAHDILTDPVQRQVYDDHGQEGITFVRRSLHSTDEDALYPILSKLHRDGKKEEARLVLREALQLADVEQRERTVQMSATLEFPCTLESHPYVGGDGTIIPELQDASLSFSVTSASPTPDNKWSATVGGSANVENGKGNGSGSIAVEYLPVQGTRVTADCDISDPFKFSIGTMRTLSNRTLMTVTLRTIPNSKDLSLSVGSHRALFDNKFRGTWALGIGTNLKFHFGLLSFTTLSDDYPECTAKLNLGMSSFPIKLSAKHEFGSRQSGYFSYAWGPLGIEVKAIVARTLTSYATCSVGVRHSVTSGLSWLLQLQRNDIVFRMPITICARNSPAYGEKILLLSFISWLTDSVIGEFVQDDETVDMTRRNAVHESSLMETEKSRRDAAQQVELMLPSSRRNRTREEACGGLVILKATYWTDDGESMDATIQLQFWVKDSKLQLPPTSMSNLLGFYGVAKSKERASAKQSWYQKLFRRRSFNNKDDSKTDAASKLTVRYSFEASVYETTFDETDEIALPRTNALRMGSSTIVIE